MPNEARHLLIATLGLLALFAGIALASPLVGKHASNVYLLSETPQLIGVASGREELAIQVDATSANPVCCTWDAPNVACATPGEGGFRYGASSGRVVCKYADQLLYCQGIGGAALMSYDEARVQTATATATATATP